MEFHPYFSGSEGGDGDPHIPDDDSVEDVRDELKKIEHELNVGFSDLSPEDFLFSVTKGEEIYQDWESYAQALSEALGNVGLYNADDITAERLSKADPEILSKLTPHVAESIYFHTFRKSRKWLGNEPIRLSRLIKQTRSLHKFWNDLEHFQLIQRLRDLEYLQEIGISSEQLLQLLGGSPGQKQNINRLAFLLSQEPKLRKYVANLKEHAEDEGPWSVEVVVIEVQEILKKEKEEIELKSTPQVKRSWDSIDEEQFQRVSHRILSMITIGHVILNDMRDGSLELSVPE